MKNRCAHRSRISETNIREIVRCFSADLTALQTAELTGINRNTINRIYFGLRERIYTACEESRPMFGVACVDESLFGPRRALKVNAGVGLTARPLSSVFSSATAKFTLKSFQTAQSLHYKGLFAVRSIPKL